MRRDHVSFHQCYKSRDTFPTPRLETRTDDITSNESLHEHCTMDNQNYRQSTVVRIMYIKWTKTFSNL